MPQDCQCWRGTWTIPLSNVCWSALKCQAAGLFTICRSSLELLSSLLFCEFSSWGWHHLVSQSTYIVKQFPLNQPELWLADIKAKTSLHLGSQFQLCRSATLISSCCLGLECMELHGQSVNHWSVLPPDKAGQVQEEKVFSNSLFLNLSMS